ncbi:carbohydrate ABC transporter permease, partial [bacterium]|nr:carbohydrate ABC transporter permease [bacterium]
MKSKVLASKFTGSRLLAASPVSMFFIVFFLLIVALMVILPFMHEISKSLSYPTNVDAGQVTLFPVNFTWGNYIYLFQSKIQILWRSFFNTVYITVIGTIWSVFFTAILAFPLSRPKSEFRIRGVIMQIVIFTLIFSPPIIPFFLAVRSYGMMDKLSSLFIIYTISSFNLILVMTYFRGLPEELFDSCRIDGGSDWRIVFQIAIPLSKPVLATIAVYQSVGIWNIFFAALLFIRTPKLMPLQPLVRSILAESLDTQPTQVLVDAFRFSMSTKSALVLLTT